MPRVAGPATASLAIGPNRPSAFDRLRDARRSWGSLDALDPTEYAAGHALFESRSDQRENLTRWLVEHVAPRAGGPSRVLSIGCGDGSVDGPVAAALAGRGSRVDYVGVEPHSPSARTFVRRLDALGGVRATVLDAPFERTRTDGLFDVVLAVHSLYYVADLAAALDRACSLRAPGGELIVLHAPLEPLNPLVRLLSPGRRQAFADEVCAHLHASGQNPRVERVENSLDLTSSGDADTDRRLAGFTVQAAVPPALLDVVRGALAERALPGPGLVLPHPVDAIVVRRAPVPGEGERT